MPESAVAGGIGGPHSRRQSRFHSYLGIKEAEATWGLATDIASLVTQHTLGLSVSVHPMPVLGFVCSDDDCRLHGSEVIEVDTRHVARKVHELLFCGLRILIVSQEHMRRSSCASRCICAGWSRRERRGRDIVVIHPSEATQG